jgi:hypothetical protein
LNDAKIIFTCYNSTVEIIILSKYNLEVSAFTLSILLFLFTGAFSTKLALNVVAYWGSGGFQCPFLRATNLHFALLFQAGVVPPLSQYAR